MTRVRYATPADILAFYGEAPRPSMQAVVLEVDGAVLGVGGLYTEAGRIIGFSDFKPEAANYKLSIIRGAKMILELMRKKRRPIYAVRDESIDTAPGFLAYLGFEQDGDYYVWHS